MNRRRRKSHAGGIILVILLILLVAALGTGVWYLMRHKNSEVYLDNTMFQGENVAGLKPEDILQRVTKQVTGVEISLSEAGQPALAGKLADFGYLYDEEQVRTSLEQALISQKSSLGAVFRSLTGMQTELVPDIAIAFDEAAFNEAVQTAKLPIPRVASSDAQLVENAEARCMEVIPEVYGNEFDEGQFRGWVKQQIDDSLAGETWENISLTFPEEFYIKPEVTADAAGYTDRAAALNTVAGAQVTYVFGSQTEVLDYDTILTWLDVNGATATVNEDKINEWLYYLKGKYNTRYRTRKFTTHSGDVITIDESVNEYGYRINEDAEVEQLREDLVSGTPVEREPIYYKTNKWDNPVYLKRDGTDDMAGTYVEVSIREQHLWYYVDGEVYVESDVVTGDVTKDRGTMLGVYPLSYKQTDYILRGGDGDGAYETPVDFWMPFIEGQGLHDASWRSKFGGKIYQGNGSHGCVNLPRKKAKKIYEKIKAGTAIVIYDD